MSVFEKIVEAVKKVESQRVPVKELFLKAEAYRALKDEMMLQGKGELGSVFLGMHVKTMHKDCDATWDFCVRADQNVYIGPNTSYFGVI